MLNLLTTVVPFAAETGAAAEESSSFLVSPGLGLMIWTLIVFFITLFVLRKKAFPIIQAAIDKRQAAINESIDGAARARTESEALLAEYRERLAEARAQAEEIVARARKSSDAREADSISMAKQEREELLAQTRHEIEAETARALQEIRREVANLTIAATEKVTRKSLTGDDQKRLVEEALKEVDFSALAGSGSNN